MDMAPRNTKSARNFVNRRMVNNESTVAMVIHALRLSPHKIIDSMIRTFLYYYLQKIRLTAKVVTFFETAKRNVEKFLE